MRLLPRLLELKHGMRIECLVQEKFLGAARDSIATLNEQHPGLGDRMELVVGADLPGSPADATAWPAKGRRTRRPSAP